MIDLLDLNPEDDDQITAVATTLRRHCTSEEIGQFRRDIDSWQYWRCRSPNTPQRSTARQEVEQWQRLLADILRLEVAEERAIGQP
jgi:hypothetical protein